MKEGKVGLSGTLVRSQEEGGFGKTQRSGSSGGLQKSGLAQDV